MAKSQVSDKEIETFEVWAKREIPYHFHNSVEGMALAKKAYLAGQQSVLDPK